MMDIQFGYISKKFENSIQVVHISKHEPTSIDCYIARPSILGNPYSHTDKSKLTKFVVDSRDEAIEAYEKYFYKKIEDQDVEFIQELKKIIEIYKENKSINFVCWCKPKRCHGDVIKDFLLKYLKGDINLDF